MIVTYDVVPDRHRNNTKYEKEYKLITDFANSNHNVMSIEYEAYDNFHSTRVAILTYLKKHHPRLKLSSCGRTIYIRKEIA